MAWARMVAVEEKGSKVGDAPVSEKRELAVGFTTVKDLATEAGSVEWWLKLGCRGFRGNGGRGSEDSE